MTLSQVKKDLVYRIVPFVISITLFILALIPFLKIIGTGLKLGIISDNISYIEQAAEYNGWTDSRKEDYQAQISLRNELIQSDDWLVSKIASGSQIFRLFLFSVNAVVLFILGASGAYIANVQMKIWKRRMRMN